MIEAEWWRNDISPRDWDHAECRTRTGVGEFGLRVVETGLIFSVFTIMPHARKEIKGLPVVDVEINRVTDTGEPLL